MSEGQSEANPANHFGIKASGEARVNAIGKVETEKLTLGDTYESYGPKEVTVSGVGEPLPNFAAYWVERNEVQTALIRCLEKQPVTEIVAGSGFGKSSLAAWASDQQRKIFQKRLWINFRQQHNFERFSRWVLQEIGFPQKDPQVTQEQLLRELVYRLNDPNHPVKTLVVMDNLESIRAAEDWSWFEQFLNDWAEQGKASRLLVTTRSSGTTSSLFKLAGFTSDEGEEFLKQEGLEGDSVKALVKVTQGHPLLLKLAARWTQQASERKVDSRTVNFFSKLFAQYEGDPASQVEQIFEVIFTALPAGQQTLLKHLSVYRVPFCSAMVQVMQQPLLHSQQNFKKQYGIDLSPILETSAKRVLGELTARGLLSKERDKFTLHPLIKSLVAKRVSKETWDYAHKQARNYFWNDLQPWTGQFDSCIKLLEGCFHALEISHYKQADYHLESRFEQLMGAGYWNELLPFYQKLTSEWQPTEKADCKNLGWSWIRLGSLHNRLNNHSAAIVAFQNSFNIFQQVQFARGEAAALGNSGVAYNYAGKTRKALSSHRQSLYLERLLEDRLGEAHSLNNIGLIWIELGDAEQAITALEGSLEIMKDLSNKRGEAYALTNIGLAYDHLSQYPKSIFFHSQALEKIQEIKDLWGEGNCLFNLGLAQAKLGENPTGLLNIEKAGSIYRHLKLSGEAEKCEEAISAFKQQNKRHKKERLILCFSIIFLLLLASFWFQSRQSKREEIPDSRTIQNFSSIESRHLERE